MNAQDYIAAGFPVSVQIEQATLTRAERDVLAAYLLPIYPKAADEMTSNQVVRNCAMPLVSCLLAQRSVASTRVGGKTKQTEQSNAATQDDIRRQYAQTCHLQLEALRRLDGADKKAQINDICGIYFATNYFCKNV